MTPPTSSLVWDTTGPLHAARCGHIDWLLEAAGGNRQHLVPEKVVDELALKGCPVDTTLFEIVLLGDSSDQAQALADLHDLARWESRLGSDILSGHNAGEAWVATVARKLGATAIIDDRSARSVVRRQGVEVHGVLWAISRGVVEERVSTPNAYSGLCDAMLDTGIRWPFTKGGFPQWYASHKALLCQ
jgi:hypothetical protein